MNTSTSKQQLILPLHPDYTSANPAVAALESVLGPFSYLAYLVLVWMDDDRGNGFDGFLGDCESQIGQAIDNLSNDDGLATYTQQRWQALWNSSTTQWLLKEFYDTHVRLYRRLLGEDVHRLFWEPHVRATSLMVEVY